MIIRLSWRPWWTRLRMRKDLKSLRSGAASFDELDIKQ
jgi:hypothetical protein